MRKRVLVVEDDPATARVLRDNLSLEGYEVECVSDGVRALDLAHVFAPDLIILDLTLPRRDGFELCEQWRRGRTLIPIMMLTARGGREDKLRGLDLGADDYVTKPFDLQELLARVRALMRRWESAPERLHLGTVTIDFVLCQAVRDQQPLKLTHREYELLRYLAGRINGVVRREELLRHVWGYVATPFNRRSVDHAIVRLRRKIEADPPNPKFLHTVHGDGYCLSMGRADSSTAEPVDRS